MLENNILKVLSPIEENKTKTNKDTTTETKKSEWLKDYWLI